MTTAFYPARINLENKECWQEKLYTHLQSKIAKLLLAKRVSEASLRDGIFLSRKSSLNPNLKGKEVVKKVQKTGRVSVTQPDTTEKLICFSETLAVGSCAKVK